MCFCSDLATYFSTMQHLLCWCKVNLYVESHWVCFYFDRKRSIIEGYYIKYMESFKHPVTTIMFFAPYWEAIRQSTCCYGSITSLMRHSGMWTSLHCSWTVPKTKGKRSFNLSLVLQDISSYSASLVWSPALKSVRITPTWLHKSHPQPCLH